MLDANDVRMLEKMLDQKLDQKLGGLRDEIRQEFKYVRSEMARGFEKVRDDIIDVIDQNIQPQLTSSVSRINRLERKTA